MSERTDRERIGGGRLNGMILISLLFHGVVLSLVFFTPSFPSPKLTFGPVYRVAGELFRKFSGTKEQDGRNERTPEIIPP